MRLIVGRLKYDVPIFHGLCTEYEECRWDYFVRHYADEVQQSREASWWTTIPRTTFLLMASGIRGLERSAVA